MEGLKLSECLYAPRGQRPRRTERMRGLQDYGQPYPANQVSSLARDCRRKPSCYGCLAGVLKIRSAPSSGPPGIVHSVLHPKGIVGRVTTKSAYVRCRDAAPVPNFHDALLRIGTIRWMPLSYIVCVTDLKSTRITPPWLRYSFGVLFRRWM